MEEIRRLINEPMRNHTTFKAGGPAKELYLPKNEDEIRRALTRAQNSGLPWIVIGRGSNLLVSDKGFAGVVIKLADDFSDISVHKNTVYAQAGATLRDLTAACIEAGLSGLEFAGGIPGALGGGVAMNAGAYGGELKDFISFVRVLTPDGEIRELANSEMRFSYRQSAVGPGGLIVLGASFTLPEGNRDASLKLLADLNARRKNCQPLNYPSAGSTFKRPPGYFAGTLIEQCGLKGCSVGGAAVSEKHAGFIINTGGATAADIHALIRHVQDEVARKTGIPLETEVKLIGDFAT
jgi:UDP-N-acetylmuramate dehydrogenase